MRMSSAAHIRGAAMGKRSTFERRDRDFYRTWNKAAVLPLLPHLPARCTYIEPCAGDGALIGILTEAGHECICAIDIEPQAEGIIRFDALEYRFKPWSADYIITNPPWRRDLLHRMIPHFAACLPTWLLFDADWLHTVQAAPFMPLLRKVVSVGRVKWIEDSPHTGKDNCAWMLFDARGVGPANFYGRAA